MGYSIILLLLPALVSASIKVHINASPNKEKVSVTFNGTDEGTISTAEIDSFNLTDSNLKAAIKASEGVAPKDVFVRAPTPWSDLYRTYNWSQVKRHTEIRKIQIVAIGTKKVPLVEKICENKLTNGDTVFSADVSDGLGVSRSIRESYTGEILAAETEYDVDFDIGMSPPMHMQLIARLSAGRIISSFAIGEKVHPESEAKFALKPSQSAKISLNATKVTIDLSVDYESRLSGYVAANYTPRHKGHHFWAYDVNEVMNATDLSSVQKSNGSLTITYYTDLHAYVTDLKTGETIVSVPYDYVLGRA